MSHVALSCEQVIRDSADGIVIADDTGRIIATSAAATSILGLADGAAFAGRLTEEILPTSLLAAGRRAMNGQDGGQWEAGDAEIARANGGTAILEYSVVQSQLKGILLVDRAAATDATVVAYTFRDVTARRASHQSLRGTADAAIQANAAKTAFLATMSHELRTPLNAILGFSDLIRKQSLGPVGKDEYVEFAREIHAGGETLLAILNDIIEVSRIETGEITLNSDEIEIDQVIESAFRAAITPDVLRARSASTSLAQGLPNLHADYRKAKGIVARLISNAAKFTADGGRVDASAYVNGAGELVIAVADDGVGIPADAIAKVSRPFYRVDSALSRMHDGSGLGLAVAAAHLNAHGGRLEIDSDIGRGTVVRAVFPANRVVVTSGMSTGDDAEAARTLAAVTPSI